MSSISILFAVLLQAATPVAVPGIDDVLAEWTSSTPGCAVGVEVEGKTVLEKGFGMADLERSVPNRGETIFEAGSVSKQFTAAAVLLLARDGKLSLDDPIRKYLPEIPDYGTPVTIRQLLTHTSGLRDWGSVAGIGGWPRTTREYTHAHVLDILSRQQALNFPPGTRWSYSNSGYNLSAILVSRVSGMPFAAFTRQRIFEPLGMSSTSWRDDHTRLVPRRALAYSRQDDGYHLDLPFENVHGNGGLLTTVGDLLIWTRNFRTPVVGDAALVAEQTTPGRFVDGQAHDYGLGVWVRDYRGVQEVRHSGSTAGYRAYLATFPDLQAGVAVLCNAANANAESITYKVVDRVLADRLKPRPEPRGTHVLTEPERRGLVGLYRDANTGVPVRIVQDGDRVRVERGVVLFADSGTRLHGANGQQWSFSAGGATVTDAFGRMTSFERVSPWAPTAAELAALAGDYGSVEAETSLTVAVDGARLVLRQRPDRVIELTPVYHSTFSSALGTVRFFRDATGRVAALALSQDRVWQIRFERKAGPAATMPPE
jgi:CubicO group peptidase (beta-lactamase class C family)